MQSSKKQSDETTIVKGRVVVITPTTGSEYLKQCIASVRDQTYIDLIHVVVVDGQERLNRVNAQVGESHERLKIVVLPHITGSSGFQGHRMYAAVPILVNCEYVCYLDEDNWFDPEHVANLVSLIQDHGLDWVYSLRKVVRRNGVFVCNDDCNSLGRWPSYDGGYNHVDMSCYLLRREIAVSSVEALNRSDRDGTGAADRELCRWLMFKFPLFHTTGRYSVNYRLASRKSEMGDIRFYEWGNRAHSRMYQLYPWRTFQVKARCAIHPHIEYKLTDDDETRLGGPLYASAELEATYVDGDVIPRDLRPSRPSV